MSTKRALAGAERERKVADQRLAEHSGDEATRMRLEGRASAAAHKVVEKERTAATAHNCTGFHFR